MPGLGAGHWGYIAIILVIVLIIWGPGKLPDIGSGLGRAIREFRKATSETRDEFHKATQPDEPQAAPAAPASSAAGAAVAVSPAPLPQPQPVGGGPAPAAPTERSSGEGDHTTPV